MAHQLFGDIKPFDLPDSADTGLLSLPMGEPSSSNAQEVTRFVQKLWNLVETPNYQSLISWSQDGKSFIVHDYHEFARKLLPKFFKHNNFNSFVRQLNLYGFRKMTKVDRGSLATANSVEPIEFYHANFRQGHPELLHMMQRKGNTQPKVDEQSVRSEEVNRLMKDIHTLRDRHQGLAEVIHTLHRENKHLVDEVDSLKRKHQQQQQILNKLIQFMVSIIYSNRLPLGKKKRPLMITAVDQSFEQNLPAAKVSKMAAPEQYPDQYQGQSVYSGDVVPDQLTSSALSSMPGGDLRDGIGNIEGEIPSFSLEASSLPDFDLVSVAPVHEQNSIVQTNSGEPQNMLALPWDQDLGQSSDVVDQISQQQADIDALQGSFNGVFNLDPQDFLQFLSNSEVPLPNYDANDTAKLLQTLQDHGSHLDLSLNRENLPMILPSPSADIKPSSPLSDCPTLERLLEERTSVSPHPYPQGSPHPSPQGSPHPYPQGSPSTN